MTNDNQIHQIQVAEVEGSFLLYNVYRLTMIFDSNSGSTLNQSLNLFVTCLLKDLFISCNKYIYSFFFQEIASVIETVFFLE